MRTRRRSSLEIEPLAQAAQLSVDEVRASLAVFHHIENGLYACRLGVAAYRPLVKRLVRR